LVGLVHRDVSPQNVLLTYEGVVKVVDFGVARPPAVRRTRPKPVSSKARSPTCRPSKLRGERIDRRTDVFAVGILLYMMRRALTRFAG